MFDPAFAKRRRADPLLQVKSRRRNLGKQKTRAMPELPLGDTGRKMMQRSRQFLVAAAPNRTKFGSAKPGHESLSNL
jgi:hypothetical protein